MLGQHTPVTRPDLLYAHPTPVTERASFCGRCRWHQYQVRPQDRAIALYNLVFAKQILPQNARWSDSRKKANLQNKRPSHVR